MTASTEESSVGGNFAAAGAAAITRDFPEIYNKSGKDV